MEKKISINNGITTGSPINDTLQNFVSVYSCPVEYEPTHFDTFPIDCSLSDTISGKAFIDDKNAQNAVLGKIKDIVTVKEFEILCNTTYRSDISTIMKYHEIIGKLLQAKIFNDTNID